MNEQISILKDVQAIDNALVESDFASICTLGNAMKGSDRDDGYDSVRPIADSLLSAAMNEDSTSVRKWMAELANMLGFDESDF